MLRQSIASVTRRVFAAPVAQTSSAACTRSFSSMTPIRPTLGARPAVFSRSVLSPFAPSTTPAQSLAADGAAAADIVPKTSITANPALSQIRCGPRNTMNRNTRLIQKRRLGFVSRMRTKNGRKILRRRMAKGRTQLGCGT